MDEVWLILEIQNGHQEAEHETDVYLYLLDSANMDVFSLILGTCMQINTCIRYDIIENEDIGSLENTKIPQNKKIHNLFLFFTCSKTS